MTVFNRFWGRKIQNQSRTINLYFWGDGVPHWFIVCGSVYLKFGGGEKGRESGNNGERSETREVSFQMSFTPAKQ